MAELTGEQLGRALAPYRELLADFVGGGVAAAQFETNFLARYKNDPTLWPTDVFDLLDAFFADVDDYVSDPVLRSQVAGIDEHQLLARARARALLARLATWMPSAGK